MIQRNVTIDIARWVFAFLVVTLHTSFWHSYLLAPIARCAVPYFYMVTGYFVLDSQNGRIFISAKKWFSLWIKYSLILLCFTILWDSLEGSSNKTWSCSDTINLLLSGTNSFIDEHMYNGKTYGISTLWFLYAGFIALLLFSFIRKFLFNKIVDSLMLLLLFGSVITNYMLTIRYDDALRTLFLAIPFMYMGGAN